MTRPVIIRIDQDFYLRIDEAFHEFWINYFLFFLTAGFHFSNIEWNTEVSLRQIRKSTDEISTVYERITRTGSDAGRVKRKSPVCYCLNNSDYVIGHALPEESWQGKEDILCK